MSGHRIFLLSPANSSGRRAGYLQDPRGESQLARRLRAGQSVPLGELYAFMSQLYFRGKLSYATTFGAPPPGLPGVLVIIPNQGLLEAGTPFSLADLQALSGTRIDHTDNEYRQPLLNSGLRLAAVLNEECEIVLLGSIASDKYVSVLLECFGSRLKFPADFVGRGDMSRGGLLLRCVQENRELDYISVAGASRRGARPPKLNAQKIGLLTPSDGELS